MSTTTVSPGSHDVITRSEGGKHDYIHSRLRSILPSGPKEVATAYSGVSTGVSLRRMASVNAEARTKLVYTPDHSSTVTSSVVTVDTCLKSPQKSPTRAAALAGKQLTLGSPAKGNGTSSPRASHVLSPTKRQNPSGSGTTAANNSPSKLHGQHNQFTSDTTLETSRTSTGLLAPITGSRGSSSVMASPPRYHFMKDSVVEIEDIRKSKSPGTNMSPKKDHAGLQNGSATVETKTTTEYVKRIAAVNAQACVNAIIMSGFDCMSPVTSMVTSYDYEGDSGGSVLGKRPSRQTGNSNQNNSKKKKETNRGSGTRNNKVPLLSTLAQTVNTTPYSLVPSSSLHDSPDDQMLHLELFSSSNEDESPPPSNERSTVGLINQEPAYNCLGLLYNSDTVHSNTVIYLTTEGRLPSVFIPPIIPQKFREINGYKGKLEPAVRKRSKKGDNGWIAMGNPIKTIRIMNREGGGRVERKYFIGVKRKDEELYVRDSIIVRSGKKENPYVAKISSIWQEKDGLILTVFWYYRTEDVPQNIATQFYPNEVMASQHHDDIGVACIDDKCQVFGYTQYCRYRANLERTKGSISPVNIVPPLCDQDIEGVSFSVLSPSAVGSHHDTLESKTKTARLTIDDEDEEDEEEDVYFCYRAFNHITGRIIRQSDK